jgi:hypothetical protein
MIQSVEVADYSKYFLSFGNQIFAGAEIGLINL